MEGKQVVKIFSLLLVLVGLTAGVVLVDQQQDIREKAATTEATCAYSCQSDHCNTDYDQVSGKCSLYGYVCCKQIITCNSSVSGQCGSSGGCDQGEMCQYKYGQWYCDTSSSCSGDLNKCSSESNTKCDGKNLGDSCGSGYTCQKGAKVEYGNDGLIACKCKTGGSSGGGNNPTATPTQKPKATATSKATATPTATPTSSPSASPSASPTTGTGVFDIFFRLQGITESRTAKEFIITIKKGNSVAKKLTGIASTSSSSGVFETKVDSSAFCTSSNTFDVFIKGQSHLAKKFEGVSIKCAGSTLNKSTDSDDELKAGDVNGDNAISIEDVAIVLKYYTDFSITVDSTKSEMVASDINKDGVITIDDVALVALNWSDFVVPGDE